MSETVPITFPHPAVYKETKLKRNFWSVTHCSELGRRLMLRQAVSHKLHKLKPNLLPPPSNSTNSSVLSYFCTLPNTNTNTGQHKNPKSLMTSSKQTKVLHYDCTWNKYHLLPLWRNAWIGTNTKKTLKSTSNRILSQDFRSSLIRSFE